MKYRYVALNTHGKEVSGVIEALNDSEAMTQLRRDGLYCSSLKRGDPPPPAAEAACDEPAPVATSCGTPLTNGQHRVDAVCVKLSDRKGDAA